MPNPIDTTPPGPEAAAPAAPLKPGAVLGKFRLLSLLGEGGMGRVFVAEDTRILRRVALKVMLPAIAREERARKMFLREARSAAAVHHDRVVTIYEADEIDGVPYIAMELLAGEPLNAFLARNPRPPLEVAIAVAYQVAEGLDAAHTHAQKLIHRDIKPANVWLRSAPGRTGVDVRILDFGLARAAGGDTTTTNAGKAMGTPLYMAPEQWDGKGVDAQSDVFSLGVMLYQMLTGNMPFQGDSVRELMFQICMPHVVPEPPPGVPADLAAFVMRMIAKDKAARVPSAAEVMRVLGGMQSACAPELPLPPPVAFVPLISVPLTDTKPQLLDEKSTTVALPPSPKPVRRRPWVAPVAVGAAVFILAGGVAGYFAGQPREGTAVVAPKPTAKIKEREQDPTPTPGKIEPAPITPAPIPKPKPPDPPPVKGTPPLLDCTAAAGVSEADVKKSQLAWAEYLGVPVEYTVDLDDGVTMAFMLVPPGKFLMGSTPEEIDDLAKVFPKMDKSYCDRELPQHAVTITRPMYVGKMEVTRDQFARFTPSGPKEGEKPEWGDDTHPVVNVSWTGAKAFAAAVAGKTLPKRFGTVRLPREAEWEYACRAGTRTRYPNGSVDPETLVNIGNVADASFEKKYPSGWSIAADDNYVESAPVGKFDANRFGLHDMIGNVWEWCEDGYDKNAYKNHDKHDPIVDQSAGGRVLRGASWDDDPWNSRPAARLRYGAADRSDLNGFRLILPQDSD